MRQRQRLKLKKMKEAKINRKVFYKLFIISVLGLSVVLFLPSISLKNKKDIQFEKYNSERSSEKTHPFTFYDKQLFQEAMNSAPKGNENSENVIKGGIVPHHLLASDMIADFYNYISDEKIKTIIILGPNHYEKGDFVALGSEYAWKTPFGIVEPNVEIIDDLKNYNLIQINEDVLENEHSVASHMPFIKQYLPKAKVVLIILSAKMDQERAKILSERLVEYVKNGDTIIIASVDFSHYLNSAEAGTKDAETLGAMKNFNYEKLYSFNSDNLDSPPSIAVLLMAMQSIEINNFEVLDNTNSGIMVNNFSSETTSYFSIVF